MLQISQMVGEELDKEEDVTPLNNVNFDPYADAMSSWR